jgi:tRNA pseudouridine55 synthase
MAVLATTDGVLLLDKPAGITSTRALATAKRALGAAKAGHTGTLDPFATGLLPLAFGEATKFSRFLTDAPKAYEATLVLGEEAESGDPETPVVRRSGERPDDARIAEVLRAFEGPQDQTPPMHSALHVGGRRLYEYARLGVEVPRSPRRIEIFALTRLSSDARSLTLAVRCSKGTYVRVLAADIGRALGCGAYLESLRRTAVGPFSVGDAARLDDLAAEGQEAARARLLPVETLVDGLPRFGAAAEPATHFCHGRVIDGDGFDADAPVAVFAPDGRFLGVAAASGDGRLAPARLMRLPAEIP